MKLLRELLIIPVLLCIVVIAAGIGAPASAESQHYYAWQPVGNSGFSDGRTFEESLFIYDGIPYLAYHAAELTVMKYTGSSWEPVGNPGFSTGDASWVSLLVYDGTPYVAYQDKANGGKATVMKYTGSSWEPESGPGFSAGGAGSPSLFIYDSTPYVAYMDSANGSKATVMKYTGSSWQIVGSPGFSAGGDFWESIFVYDGTPYVASVDNNGRAMVLAYTEYVPAIPEVTAIDTKFESTNRDLVTITGQGFTGATGVLFGTTSAFSFTVINSTVITAISPPAIIGPVHITVTTLGGTSATSPADEYSYLPVIISVNPTSGPTTNGTSVTLFGRFTGATGVLLAPHRHPRLQLRALPGSLRPARPKLPEPLTSLSRQSLAHPQLHPLTNSHSLLGSPNSLQLPFPWP